MFDIISFSDQLDWTKDTSRGRQQLMLRFARERKVLNINPAGSWRGKPYLKLVRVAENLWHLDSSKFWFRTPKPVVQNLSVWTRRWIIHYLCLRLGLRHPIYLVWWPEHAEVLETLPPRFTVYYVFDKYTSWPRPDHERLQLVSSEEYLARKAHVVVCVSDPLCDYMKGIGARNVHCVPNGASVPSTSSDELSAAIREPSDIAAVKRPRIGFVGSVNAKVDLDILIYVAKTLNECSLVIVGDVRNKQVDRQKWSILSSLGNVYVLGWKPQQAIANYMGALDVGLIPNLAHMEYIRYTSPLKLYEYLAVGIPVISSPIPEVLKMNGLVYTATTPQEWVEMIQCALRENSSDLRQKRQQFARENSWDVRAQRALEIMQEHYTAYLQGRSGSK